MNGTFWARVHGPYIEQAYCGRCHLGRPRTWCRFWLADPPNAYQLRCTKCNTPLAGAIVIGPFGVDRHADPAAQRWVEVPS